MRRIAIPLLFLIAAAWGATFNVTQDALSGVSTNGFLFWRFLLAAVLLMPLAAFRRELDLPTVRSGLLLGALLYSGYWLQTEGLRFTSASRSSFLTALNVVAVPLLEPLLNRTRLSLNGLAGAVLAATGTFLLVGGGFALELNRGDLLTLACAASFGLYLIVAARLTQEGRALGITAVQTLVVALLSLVAGAVFPAPRDPFVIGVIVGTAVVTTAFAFVALLWAQAHVSATEAAIILSFEPVATAITALVIYRDPMTASLLAGGGLIVAGMIVSQWKR